MEHGICKMDLCQLNPLCRFSKKLLRDSRQRLFLSYLPLNWNEMSPEEGNFLV